jgi:hypothetical protein
MSERDFNEVMYAWTPVTRSPEGDQCGGAIELGTWPGTGWSRKYDYTGGACVTYLHDAPPLILMSHLLADFHAMVIRDGLDPIDVHEAFFGIYEYRRMIAPDSMPVRAVKRELKK